MLQRNRPNKEEVREWLRQEIGQQRPPPYPAEIRHQLGWNLVEFEYDDRYIQSILEIPI